MLAVKCITTSIVSFYTMTVASTLLISEGANVSYKFALPILTRKRINVPGRKRLSETITSLPGFQIWATKVDCVCISKYPSNDVGRRDASLNLISLAPDRRRPRISLWHCSIRERKTLDVYLHRSLSIFVWYVSWPTCESSS